MVAGALSVKDSPPSPQSPKSVPLCRKWQVAGPPRPPFGMSHACVPSLLASVALLMVEPVRAAGCHG